MEKEEINSLFRNTLGTLMKGGYALLWEVKNIKYGQPRVIIKIYSDEF